MLRIYSDALEITRLAVALSRTISRQNPGLADQILRWIVGDDLARLTDDDTTALRAERLDAARRGNLDGVAHRTWRDRLLRRN